MIEEIAWKTFKNTGNINTMMELLEVDKALENKKMDETIATPTNKKMYETIEITTKEINNLPKRNVNT